jgi:hypothetical protein
VEDALLATVVADSASYLVDQAQPLLGLPQQQRPAAVAGDIAALLAK